MADIGQTDLSFKPDVNIAAIASLAQKKAEMEQQQAFQNSEMQTQAQNRTMQIIKMAGDLTSSTIKNYAETQQLQGQKHLSGILATQNELTPYGAGPEATLFSRLPNGQVGPALPQKVPTANMVPRNQTPEYQAELQSALEQATPKETGAAIAGQQFPKAPTTTDQLLARSLLTGNQGMANKVTTAKQNEKPPQVGKIFQNVGTDGKSHNMRLEADGTTTDLGLATPKSSGAGMSSINRLMPDGTTHKILVASDGSERDLGLIGTSTTNVPPAQVRTTSVVAQQVLPHFDEVRSLINQADAKGLIGPRAGRVYSKFLAGKVGTTGDAEADKLLGDLRTKSSLLASAALKVHFGARGGQQMYEHFTKNLDTTFQSKALLEGELNGFQSFLESYANPNPQGNIGGAQQPTSSPQGIDAIAGLLNLKKRK